jgi:alpha-glucan,water dikinase
MESSSSFQVMAEGENSGGDAVTESIATRSGLKLQVHKRATERQIELLLQAQTRKPCILHWGLRGKAQAGWRALPQSAWPEGTKAVGTDAMQTPFRKQNGDSRIEISLTPGSAPDLIEFALFFPEESKWDNNGRRNYQISVPGPGRSGVSAAQALKARTSTAQVLLDRVFEVEDLGQIAVAVVRGTEAEQSKPPAERPESSGAPPPGLGGYKVVLVSDLPGPLALHWGIARRSPHEWLLPPESLRPPGTILWEGHTAQTPFSPGEGLNHLEMSFSEAAAPLGVQFVLRQGTDGRWLKHRGGNFYVPIHTPARPEAATGAADLAAMVDRIVQAEMGPSSWTLMHRFNLCYDLLDEARGRVGAMALLYVWLRFSAIRQLTWQRNYNTKPRELAHAQDRLTGKIADLYRSEVPARPLLRLMLATIGRGGDGQRIRDEILQIMHRHHIKEVSGHFTEEWHQKLHNNTTPDDIVICEAYLEFLRSDGNLDRYFQTLQAGGVTRERLESFERPIRTSPDFVPHLKGVLIGEFENFLKILKAVHSATDLETAIHVAQGQLDGSTQGMLWEIWNHRNDPTEALVWLVSQITEARRRISHSLQQGAGLRPLLYLDLGLEQLIRMVVERNLHQRMSGDQLAELIGRVLENVGLSHEDSELAACLRHWERLCRNPAEPHFSPEWSLHAKSVVDRIGRALSDWTDRVYQLLQPKAESLGQAFLAENWTVALFSEEVVRGSSLGFVLSMLLQQIGRLLRQSANLGPWQIVSRGQGTGRIELVQELRSVQGKSYKEPMVIVAEKVMGDEELPKEVVAVVAPDVTDLVSHVAVRARNAQVLFASCSEPAVLQQLKARGGQRLRLEVTAAGDVTFGEPVQEEGMTGTKTDRPKPKVTRPKFTDYAVPLKRFSEQIVGAKSCSQLRLRGKLPDWIQQPASMALPFGVFEKLLSLEQNRETEGRCQALSKAIEKEFKPEIASKLRDAVGSVTAPAEFKTAIEQVAAEAGLRWPENWESAWRCIRQVWASKWNDRAILSRRNMGLKDEDLFMSVLIQPVVEADYAFVIHTANPSTGDRDELYTEVVPGLGETLVGNYPGRALSFVWDKRTEQPRLISFPGKSIGLFGGGLIFRSDSNGEDLAGYAGAGLYDSVLLNPPRERRLDYSEESLVWDTEFRGELLAAIARLGVAIEKTLGSPQDIEGAVAKGEYFVVQTRPQVGL